MARFCRSRKHDTDITGRYTYKGKPWNCKACQKERRKEKRRTPEYQARVNAKRQALKVELLLLMGGKCIRCGFDESPVALDFDHIDPTTKELDIAASLSRGTPFKRIRDEVLAKCQILCANCHRVKTFGDLDK